MNLTNLGIYPQLYITTKVIATILEKSLNSRLNSKTVIILYKVVKKHS
jgi:hypothetical protein